MKLISIATLAFVALACLAGPAAAQAVADTGTTVTVPWGSAAADIALAGLAAVSAAVAYAFKFIPSHMRWLAQVAQVDQLIEKGFAYARSEIKDELGDKAWTVDLKNKAVATTVRYAIDQYPKLIERLGGTAKFQAKAQARIQEWIEEALG